MSYDPWKMKPREKDGDALAPTWVHRNTGRNRADRRAAARKKGVLPSPATNKPHETKEN